METKVYYAPIELKEEGKNGEFEAVFATLNVIDHDRDVTVEGAFKSQNVVVEPWNHGRSLPAGKGLVFVDGDKVKVKGQFFMGTQTGKENYLTVKELGEQAEWSYTFAVEESETGELDGEPVRFLKKLDVIGVSPVTRGAGIGTRTEGIKSEKRVDEDKEEQDQEEQDDNGKGKVNSDKPSDQFNTLLMIAEAEMIVNRYCL